MCKFCCIIHVANSCHDNILSTTEFTENHKGDIMGGGGGASPPFLHPCPGRVRPVGELGVRWNEWRRRGVWWRKYREGVYTRIVVWRDGHRSIEREKNMHVARYHQ